VLQERILKRHNDFSKGRLADERNPLLNEASPEKVAAYSADRNLNEQLLQHRLRLLKLVRAPHDVDLCVCCCAEPLLASLIQAVTLLLRVHFLVFVCSLCSSCDRTATCSHVFTLTLSNATAAAVASAIHTC
jgi:hypothetical protein